MFDTDYLHKHRALLGADHVTWTGELGSVAKTTAFTDAAAFVYTCSRTYVEAGAAALGESLRAGTPVAALCWREGTCAEAAICEVTGAAAFAHPAESDEEAARALAVAIEQALTLNATNVQEIGLQRFDPARHFRSLAPGRDG